MKIAQIAPLWNNVSSRGPSDGERTPSYLSDELVRRGHEVTLFASADSRTSATLEVLCSIPLDRTPDNWSRAGAAIVAVEQVFGPRADEFDLIHSHFGIDGFPMAQRCPTPTLTTYTTGSICRSMFRCSNNFETSRLLQPLMHSGRLWPGRLGSRPSTRECRLSSIASIRDPENIWRLSAAYPWKRG